MWFLNGSSIEKVDLIYGTYYSAIIILENVVNQIVEYFLKYQKNGHMICKKQLIQIRSIRYFFFDHLIISKKS